MMKQKAITYSRSPKDENRNRIRTPCAIEKILEAEEVIKQVAIEREAGQKRFEECINRVVIG